jgi:hypothetical protein
MAQKPSEETWDLDDLMPHEFAQKVLGDPPMHEVAELAEDMKKNGQRDAINILPNGSILNGLTRWLAAKLLGLQTLQVVVHDLDSTAAKKLYFVSQNILSDCVTGLVCAGPVPSPRCMRHSPFSFFGSWESPIWDFVGPCGNYIPV